MEEAAMGEAAPLSSFPRQLEEGEISDSEAIDLDNLEYTPLQRPDNYRPYLNPNSLMMMNIQDDQSDESENEASSDEDSDSDACARPAVKRRKIKTKRHIRAEPSDPPKKKDKYNIWCKTVQEDTLADDLLVCDVTASNYLGIETYHHRLFVDDRTSGRDGEVEAGVSVGFRFGNKRTHRDRNRRDARLRLKRLSDSDGDDEKGEVRHIPDLVVDSESSAADVAKDIAAKLCEEKDSLILRIVEHAGKQKAIELFKETKRIEEDGGMIVMNGTRRRTPGGVFIFLLKRDKDVTREVVNKIFSEDRLENKERNKNQCRYRNKKVEELKQSLTGSALPVLRTRAEQWAAAQMAAEDLNHHVSNPPPSPATDGKDGSSDVDTVQYSPRSPTYSLEMENVASLKETVAPQGLGLAKHLPQDPRAGVHNTYDEDYLEIGCGDDMDLF